MRRELLFVAAGVAALVLTAQVVNWRGVSVNTATGIANVTNIGFRGTVTASNFVGDGSALTGIASPETNWWAVFNIIDPAGYANGGQPLYSDVTLKCSTNGMWHYSGITPVFRYTTADPQLNGSPGWENFATNWYPRCFYYPNHSIYEMDWATETRCLDPTGSDSIYDALVGWDAHPASASYPHVWVIMVRDTRPFFHPTNNLHWFYTLQGNTVSPNVRSRDGTPLPTTVWFPVAPAWVTHDPRPRVIQNRNASGGSTYIITNQHQQP